MPLIPKAGKYCSASFNFLDEPSTTSQITYNIRMANSAGSTISFSESSKTALIAIEVGA